jgi:hypothetical protein
MIHRRERGGRRENQKTESRVQTGSQDATGSDFIVFILLILSNFSSLRVLRVLRGEILTGT